MRRADRISPQSGRHFLQIPGPTNVPDRVLRAIDRPTIDHRGPQFRALTRKILSDIRRIFKTKSPVVIYPASGTGAWEAALVNTLSPGDKILLAETGHFAHMWQRLARRLGLEIVSVPTDWRHAADPDAVEAALREDRSHEIKAVCVVHNETSTGVVSSIPAVREAIDNAGHPALLMVDAISSLACMDYRMDEWDVDVTIAASQKGLMMPPGLCFNAVSPRALEAAKTSKLPKSFWCWQDVIQANKDGSCPYTPATNLLFGLHEAIQMLLEEGLDRVFERHARLAEATRRAVKSWDLQILCADPAAYSNSLTAVLMPEGCKEEDLRRVILETFDMSLGAGLGKLAGRVIRIGHLGGLSDLMLAGTLAGIEMGLSLARVPHRRGGVQAAMDYLAEYHIPSRRELTQHHVY
jgi:alanine-glyoxylate transaminase/serine-glyoxylate transaminase/serine-pyruvate transaminase